MASTVLAVLESIGAVQRAELELFWPRTRDRDDMRVLKDRSSGVILIDSTGPDVTEYEAGDYAGAPTQASIEEWRDTNRRIESFAHLLFGRRILDFGCGTGAFLRAASQRADEAVGVELHNGHRARLNDDGLQCQQSLAQTDGSFDSIFLFHVLEHLSDPLRTLKDLNSRLNPGGTVVVEVPHARDFLIEGLACRPFIDFTLWSQHLVLHTRESLRLLLAAADFSTIDVHGVQRYGLANHMAWLASGEPGGHKSQLAWLDSPALCDAYAGALATVDMTDTLIAVATKKG